VRCSGCDAPLTPRRRDPRYCSAACRQRGFARKRLEESQQDLAALEHLRRRLVANVERWAAAAEGRRRFRRRIP